MALFIDVNFLEILMNGKTESENKNRLFLKTLFIQSSSTMTIRTGRVEKACS